MPAGKVNVPTPVYGICPPVADTVTVAFPPLHKIGEAIIAFAIN